MSTQVRVCELMTNPCTALGLQNQRGLVGRGGVRRRWNAAERGRRTAEEERQESVQTVRRMEEGDISVSVNSYRVTQQDPDQMI